MDLISSIIHHLHNFYLQLIQLQILGSSTSSKFFLFTLGHHNEYAASTVQCEKNNWVENARTPCSLYFRPVKSFSGFLKGLTRNTQAWQEWKLLFRPFSNYDKQKITHSYYFHDGSLHSRNIRWYDKVYIVSMKSNKSTITILVIHYISCSGSLRDKNTEIRPLLMYQ